MNTEQKDLNSNNGEKQINIILLNNGVTTVELPISSGRQDGKGKTITVVYLAGGNPI